jgi:hypothetical protein
MSVLKDSLVLVLLYVLYLLYVYVMVMCIDDWCR